MAKSNYVYPEDDGDEIVISGISGRFPNSENVAALAHNLYNKIDMIDELETRWKHANPSIPKRNGKVQNLEKFDATFFGVHFKQAHCMDPQCRMLVEHAYEAILDAGLSPAEMKGSKTGVFTGVCSTESDKDSIVNSTEGYAIIGCNRGMMANRLSYILDVNGPSFVVDSACSSSMMAVDVAYRMIRNGECDAALVCASNLTLAPLATLQFAKLGVLAMDGFCRPFDENASGYTRSEALCVILLQRRKLARRCYATLVHSKINCDGYKEEGITYPSGKLQTKLLNEFYKEINVNPATVDYVEAHGTGTPVGDPEECSAIYEVFCKDRKGPLPIGSIKSNIGHTEPASGLCSIAKLILSYENKKIPPNINLDTIRQSIPPLKNGDLQVIRETTDFNGSLTAVSSFGFGGANGHVLLRGNKRIKLNHGIPTDKLPRLVCWAGRTEEACTKIFDEVVKKPLDAEFIGLLQATQTKSVPANVCRGYAVFNQEGQSNATCAVKETKITGQKQPLVWVFSGMGSQWVGMGRDLMQLPLFRKSIEKCHEILKRKQLDLISIITSEDPTTFDNILHSFVGIAAIQIGLVDILKELGVEFDYVIGHSVGELGCAYADNCFTAEEMILSAYSRGMASLETEVIHGSMAAIGLSYQQIRPMVPAGIEVACHNGIDSSTISGPAELVATFVEELKGKGIFAKEVPCSNIPYHSKYIAAMGPKLKARLEQVIKSPKKRSAKWLSTSVARHNWDKEESWYCSPDYQTNNLLNAVLFEETMTLLPQDAVTLEISPHALLQAILRKSLPNAQHLSLTKRGSKNNLEVLLSGLGKLFMQGIDMPISKLYPTVQFPVSAGTPMISPLIRWDHSEDWYVAKFSVVGDHSGEQTFKISIGTPEYSFITGHKIDGRVLFPATGYIYLAWKTFSNMNGNAVEDMPVEITDVKFVRATTLSKESPATLVVMVQRGTGKFEISENNSTVVTGTIRVPEKIRFVDIKPPKNNATLLPTSDFYKELKLRGYHYDGLFRSVVEARSDGLGGRIKWNNDFISFMDCLLQMGILGTDSRQLVLPIGLESVRIDPAQFLSSIEDFDPENKTGVVQITGSKPLSLLKAPGMELQGLKANAVGRRKPPGEPVLESYQFVPYFSTLKLSSTDAIRALVQLGLENFPSLKVKAVECDDGYKEPLLPLIQDTLGDLPLVTSELTVLSNRELDLPGITIENSGITTQKNCMFIIGSNYCQNLDLLKDVAESCSDNGFIITRESGHIDTSKMSVENLTVISALSIDNEVLIMLQCRRKPLESKVTVIPISIADTKYTWVETVKEAVKHGQVYLVAQGEPTNGIIGLVNCLRKEPNCDAIAIFIDDPKAPKFDPTLPLYKAQLQKNLAINVYRNGSWGSFRHLLLNDLAIEEPRSIHCYANAINKGDLSSLTWFQGELNVNDPTKDIVRVRYSALNFRDVMVASGKLNLSQLEDSRLTSECDLGLEYSGITRDGQRVMGMVRSGAMATYAEAIKYITWNVPDSWSLQDACTVPVVYCTVYYSFFVSVQIQKGKKILIHAGTGGIGLSAIRVALAYGLEVFTTVSTPEKKQFIRYLFPEIPESHIGNSRDTSFYDMVMVETDGAGVDYVLNSLSDEKLLISLNCLGQDGHFIEIGKYDIMNDNKIGLGVFKNNITFHVVMVDQLLKKNVETDRKLLHDLIQKDVDRGIITPLKSTVFKAMEIEQAFRYLASAKHMGKVLLEVRENDFDRLSQPIPMIPRIYCQPDLSYVIPGGLGGFGLELADWLILRGCRNLVLSSSRGISKPYQEYRIKLWRSYGVTIYVSTADITTPDGCLQLIKEATALAPVGGIYNLAVRLRDNIFENQDSEKFMECIVVKAGATRYLDEISRRLCPRLEQFVVFSSVSCGRGNAGQTNYGLANSVMERIVEQRVAAGLPGKAIQWGAIGEVGLVADMAENKVDMEIGGTLQQRISSCLTVMDQLLSTADPIVASMVVAEKKVRKGAGIVETVMNIMGLRDSKTISMDVKLSEMGMDSLMAVEIRQTLERDFELFLSPQDLRSLTFQKLKDHVAQKATTTDGSTDLTQQLLLFRNLSEEVDSDKNPLRLASKDNGESFKKAVLFVPGIEGGVGAAWRKLAARFDSPTFITQMTKAKDAVTIQNLTSILFKDLYSTLFKRVKEYQIVGFSVGGLVALQIAADLEKKGYKGRLILIDSSPLLMKKFGENIGSSGESDLEGARNLTMMMLLATYKDKNIQEEILKAPTWEQKVDICVKLGTEVYSAQFMRDSINGCINRGLMCKNLNIEEMPKIQSDILLIRPTVASIQDIDEDYGLSAHTNGAVNIKFLEGDHLTILDNEELSNVIQDTFRQ